MQGLNEVPRTAIRGKRVHAQAAAASHTGGTQESCDFPRPAGPGDVRGGSKPTMETGRPGALDYKFP